MRGTSISLERELSNVVDELMEHRADDGLRVWTRHPDVLQIADDRAVMSGAQQRIALIG